MFQSDQKEKKISNYETELEKQNLLELQIKNFARRISMTVSIGMGE